MWTPNLNTSFEIFFAAVLLLCAHKVSVLSLETVLHVPQTLWKLLTRKSMTVQEKLLNNNNLCKTKLCMIIIDI